MLAAVLDSVSLCDWSPHTHGAYCARCPLHEIDPLFREVNGPERSDGGGGGAEAALHLVGYDEDVASSLMGNGRRHTLRTTRCPLPAPLLVPCLHVPPSPVPPSPCHDGCFRDVISSSSGLTRVEAYSLSRSTTHASPHPTPVQAVTRRQSRQRCAVNEQSTSERRS